MSCKDKKTVIDNNQSEKINLSDKWNSLRNQLINQPEDINWNQLISIEGQMGDDYAYLFDNAYAKDALEKTTYSDLKDYDFYGTSVKVFEYNNISANEKYIFYILENNQEFTIIGFLMNPMN